MVLGRWPCVRAVSLKISELLRLWPGSIMGSVCLISSLIKLKIDEPIDFLLFEYVLWR
jgi:hypothetical protein